MSKYLQMIETLVIPPRDEATCEHHWTYYTYSIGTQVTTKKLCFYCKKVEV